MFVLYLAPYMGHFIALTCAVACRLSVAAVAVPIWMFVSLIRCAMFDWRSNTKELIRYIHACGAVASVFYWRDTGPDGTAIGNTKLGIYRRWGCDTCYVICM